MAIDYELNDKEAAALAAIAKVLRDSSDLRHIVADRVIESIEGGHRQVIEVNKYGGNGVRNILVDALEIIKSRTEPGEEFSEECAICLDLADRLDEMAVQAEPEGTA